MLSIRRPGEQVVVVLLFVIVDRNQRAYQAGGSNQQIGEAVYHHWGPSETDGA